MGKKINRKSPMQPLTMVYFLRLNEALTTALLAFSFPKTNAYERLYYIAIVIPPHWHQVRCPLLAVRPSSLGMQNESCTTWTRCLIPCLATSMECFTILSFHLPYIHVKPSHNCACTAGRVSHPHGNTNPWEVEIPLDKGPAEEMWPSLREGLH